MKFYLDDIRNPVSDGWQIIRSAEKCIELLGLYGHFVTEISFDHDLGTELSGYDVALWIEEQCYFGNMRCPKWNVHSANPVGRKNIETAMKNAEKYSRR